MKTKAETLGTGSGRATSKQAVAVKLSQLAFEALGGADGQSGAAGSPARVQSALRVYLNDKGAGRPAWLYPGFLRGSETQDDVALELDVNPDLWLQFEAEAKKQGISVQQLLEHAAFYFAAELNSGRVTQRILDDLEAAEAENEA